MPLKDPIKRKEYQKKYRLNNLEKLKKTVHENPNAYQSELGRIVGLGKKW